MVFYFMWHFHDFVHPAKWPHFKDSKIWNPLPARSSVTQGQTLITLKINPSNGHDYVDTWEACFYTGTPTKLRGSDRSDASEAAVIQEM